MGLDKRTLKIVIIVVVVILILGGITGLLLGLFLFPRYVELEVWPRAEEYRVEEPLIQFRTTDAGSWHPWVQRINDFLREYETSVPEMPPRGPCSLSRLEHGPRSQHCESVMRMWAPCTVDDFYGYPMGKPCVFLRLNHIHYWVPQPYNVSTSLPIPPEMPENLKQILRQRSTYQYGDHIWVTCDGEFSSDQENIGPIQYIPSNMPPGFPTNKLHTADRLSRYEQNLPDRSPEPLIAVFFENPRRGVVINVECRIWSRDIYYDRSSRYGRARFEIHVE